MGKWRTWRPSEVQRLQTLIGQAPMPLVTRRWNQWAAQHGVPPRSEAGLRRKAHAMGWSVACCGAWVTLAAAARLLTRSRRSLQSWMQQGLVVHRRGVIQVASLRRLAQSRPWLFAGCPREGLLELLQDTGLVDQLVAAYPCRRSSPRAPHPVECISTGQRFESMRAAGRELYLDGSSIGKAIKEGREAAGLRFRLAA